MENHNAHQEAQRSHTGPQNSAFETASGVESPHASLLQLAANSSPQIAQLKALQAGVNKSPQVQQAAQLQAKAAPQNAPVQMTRKHLIDNVSKFPEKFQDKKGVTVDFKKYTKEDINKVLADKDNIDEETRQLIFKKYNQGVKRGTTKKTGNLKKPSDLIKTSTLSLDIVEEIEYGDSDSETMTKASYLETLKKQRETSEIKVVGQTCDDKVIPCFDGLNAAMRVVRLFQRGLDNNEGSRFIGAQFAVKTGNHYGLYDAPQGNDLVFINLKPVKNEVLTFTRESDIGSWDHISKRLGEEFGGEDQVSHDQMKEDILKSIRGKLVSDNDVIREAAGAMSCDAKTSLDGFLSYLEEFEDSKEVNPSKLFSSNPEKKPVWSPSVGGGRIKPKERKEELKKKKEMSSKMELVEKEDIQFLEDFGSFGKDFVEEDVKDNRPLLKDKKEKTRKIKSVLKKKPKPKEKKERHESSESESEEGDRNMRKKKKKEVVN